jgi:hypothetical protein
VQQPWLLLLKVYCPSRENRMFFTALKASPFFKEVDFNRPINWLKHPDGKDEILLTEFEVTMVIIRAISKFFATNDTGSNQMRDFCRWAFARGHLPPPPMSCAAAPYAAQPARPPAPRRGWR